MAARHINQASAVQCVDAAAHAGLRHLPRSNQISCCHKAWRIVQQCRKAQVIQRQLIAVIAAHLEQPADADGGLAGAEGDAHRPIAHVPAANKTRCNRSSH